MENDLTAKIQESVNTYFSTNDIEPLKSIADEPDFNDLIVDYILLLDITLTDKQPLINLLRDLSLPSELLLTTLDTELLAAIGQIDDAKFVDRKIIRANTNLLYKQTRYNLLREESEGYSKLVVLVIEGLVLPLDVYFNKDEKDYAELRNKDLQKTGAIIENIRKLVGYFDLDPNRVLDILLDLFIANFLDYWDYFLLLFQGLVETQNNLGQLLGFKYRSYQEAPVQLYYVSAILIKHSLLNINDLYPFLNEKPVDQYKKELKEQVKSAGRFVRVVMGELGAVEQTQEKTAKSRNCQKSGLLECCLAIGDLKTSLVLLNEVKFIDKEIGYNICRIIHLLIDQVDTRIFKTKSKDINLFCPPVSTYQTTCGLSTRVYTGKKHYPSLFRFFYPWKDGLIEELNIKDKVETKEETTLLLKQVNGLLYHAGAYLSSDNLLLGKIIRFGKHLLKLGLERECKQMLSEYIFPAVSLSQTNPNLSNELWKILKQFDYKTRYALYGEWRHFTYSRIDILQIASTGNRKDIQYIMNRLSKENVKLNGRQIGKIVHSNPTLTFSYIINMIESYDNMIPFVVEATRYLTDLDLDILCFSLLESLSKPKEKIEPNGTTIEKWLKSLSTFSGTLFKKHSIDLQGLLQYICNQLANNQVYDLVILQDLITQMGGTSLPEEATAIQLECLAGGELLRKEGFLNNQKSIKKTSARLMKHLKTNMIKMGILIAQQQQEIIYRQKDEFDLPSLKILGWLNDLCLKSFLQYFEFVFDNNSEYPTFEYLVERIRVPFAFHIYRQKILIDMQGRDEKKEEVDDGKEIEEEDEEPQVEIEEEKEEVGAKNESEKVESDLETKELETKEITNVSMNGADESTKTEKDAEEMQVDEPDERTEQPDDKSSVVEDDMQVDVEIHPVLQELSTHILQMNLTPLQYVDYYTNFWCLSLSDIVVPSKRYEIQMKKHKQTLSDLERGKNDSRNRKEKERVLSMQLQLVKEFNNQKHFHKRTMERLKMTKSGWFKEENLDTPAYILEQVYERCCISPADAIYCAQFLKLLHSLGTENLSTLMIYDKILDSGCTHSILFSLTEFEAKNYGLFLSSILETLTKWYKDEALYDQVTKDVPGFKKDSTNILSYKEFKQMLINWHLQLRQCFLPCLKSGEYMQMRNAIIVLDKINDFFPTIDFIGQQIEISIMSIEQNEIRGDMKQLARSYYAKIQHCKKEWKELELLNLEPQINFAGQSINFKQLIIDENDKVQKVEPLAWAKPTEEKEEKVEKVREWDKDKNLDRRDKRDERYKDSLYSSRDSKERRGAAKTLDNTRDSKERDVKDTKDTSSKEQEKDLSKRVFTVINSNDVSITIEKPEMETGELDEGEIDEKNEVEISQWTDEEKDVDIVMAENKEGDVKMEGNAKEVEKQEKAVEKTPTKSSDKRDRQESTPTRSDRDKNDRDRRPYERERRNDRERTGDRNDRLGDRNERNSTSNDRADRFERDRNERGDRNAFGNDRNQDRNQDRDRDRTSYNQPERGSFGNDRLERDVRNSNEKNTSLNERERNDRSSHGSDRFPNERDRFDRNPIGNDRGRDRNDRQPIDRPQERTDRAPSERQDRNEFRRSDGDRTRTTDRGYNDRNRDYGREKDRGSREDRNLDSDRTKSQNDRTSNSSRQSEKDLNSDNKERPASNSNTPDNKSDKEISIPNNELSKNENDDKSPSKPVVPEEVLRKISLVKSQIEKSAGLDKEQVLKLKIEQEKKNREMLKKQEETKASSENQSQPKEPEISDNTHQRIPDRLDRNVSEPIYIERQASTQSNQSPLISNQNEHTSVANEPPSDNTPKQERMETFSPNRKSEDVPVTTSSPKKPLEDLPPPKVHSSPIREDNAPAAIYIAADQVQVESKTEHKYERPKFSRTTSLDSNKEDSANDNSANTNNDSGLPNRKDSNQDNDRSNLSQRSRQDSRDSRNERELPRNDRFPRRDFQRDNRMRDNRDNRDRDMRDNRERDPNMRDRDRFPNQYQDRRNDRYDRPNDRPNDRRFNRNDRYQTNKAMISRLKFTRVLTTLRIKPDDMWPNLFTKLTEYEIYQRFKYHERKQKSYLKNKVRGLQKLVQRKSKRVDTMYSSFMDILGLQKVHWVYQRANFTPALYKLLFKYLPHMKKVHLRVDRDFEIVTEDALRANMVSSMYLWALSDVIQHIPIMTKLEEIMIRNVDQKFASQIAQYLPLSNITKFNLEGDIALESLQRIFSIIASSNVKSVELALRNISTSGMIVIASGIAQSNVETLKFKNMSQSFDIHDVTVAFSNSLWNSRMKTLILPPLSMRILSTILPNSTIEHLVADGTEVDYLLNTVHQTKLKHLELKCLNSFYLRRLLLSLINSNVETLVLFNSDGNTICQLISECVDFLKLKKLSLTCSEISNVGLEILLGSLSTGNCQLEELDLGKNRIDNDGIKILTQYLPYTMLKKVFLSGNEITNTIARVGKTKLINHNCVE
ncbi:THO complex subunit 2 [Boothiomyces sp. JEL0866]|nr:THO complex subunit 2 [Boothiomyces sp. JEL0866]